MCRLDRQKKAPAIDVDRPPRPSAADDADLFDDLWTSLADTASEFTRSLVGLPMFYRRTAQGSPAFDPTMTVFAEPGILSPQIITFHLDKDVVGFYTPFRFVTRPVTVFDVFTQAWRNRDGQSEAGMMFLFGTPLENSRWLVSPGLKVTGSSMFHRPWSNPDEWIRRRSWTPSLQSALWKRRTDDDVAYDPLGDLGEYLDSIDREASEWNKLDRVFNGWKKPLEQDRPAPQPAKSPFETFGNDFRDRFQHLKDREPAKDTKYYSTETSTTTHITHGADGSRHEETTTTERLPDGTTKTTKLVRTPKGETRTETIVNKPFINERFRSLSRTEESSSANGAEGRGMTAAGSTDSNGNGDERNRAWWFWSRK